ncbi:MAG: phospholipid carrier-dependent glycosyltransferase [Ignavibacteriae bacterium]|nr:phospholipid carrier-dependent glycosyltransferase [Ignavibacteriota bacterium]MCO6447402.1 glycosyltransferase family 39 protein [Ignavibacterium album]HOJ08937.1 phospholipid carrier-dependent glycosyltransferase [Ignavibacteriaceae bacterium]
MNQKILFSAIIFFTNLIVYGLFNYGGIRSPDSEIVFRTTESLLHKHEFAVQEPINWDYFGLARGKDNKHYSIFGPLESIFAVPLLYTADYLKNNNIFLADSSIIPLSFHVLNDSKDAGLYYLEDERPPTLTGHYERFIASFFNVIVGALSGIFFFYLILSFTKSNWISLYTTFIYSFGSLIFSYTGTFFSEPLCTLFIIISFLFVVKNETDEKTKKQKFRNYFYSGLFLGLAITTHISAVITLPFYYMFLLGQESKVKLRKADFAKSALYFTTGLVIFCSLLLYYNYARFGNVFETGRSADPLSRYAFYTNPLPGIFGLLFSAGKGIFIYSPVVLLGILFWKPFHKRYPHLSIAIIGMILVRIFFLASRSDWHAGFALGPRYLLIIIPFLFIPIAIGIKEIVERQKLKQFILVGAFSLVCIIQQLFFSTGEIFSYLHIIYKNQEKLGNYVLLHNSLYLSWEYSPALYLLNYKTGPFLLGLITNNNYQLWLIMSGIFFLVFLLISIKVYSKIRD